MSSDLAVVELSLITGNLPQQPQAGENDESSGAAREVKLLTACLVEDFGLLFQTDFQWLYTLPSQGPEPIPPASCLCEKLSQHSPVEALILGVFSLRLFLRLNFLGPPFAESGAPEGLPPCFLRNDISLTSQLAVDGEILQEYVFAPFALLLARIIFDQFLTEADIKSLLVWRARAALTLQRSLTGGRKYPCASLRKAAVDDFSLWLLELGVIDSNFYHVLSKACRLGEAEYSKIVSDSQGSKKQLMHEYEALRSLLVLELGNALSTYGMIEAHKELLAKSHTLGFVVELSGRMGIKRQYQRDPIAQLVMKIRDTEHGSESERVEDQTETEAGSSVFASEGQTDDATPKAVDLREIDPETDVLEHPKFLDDDEAEAKVLTITQQLFVLGWANILFETTNDELTMQTVTSIVREALHLPSEASTTDDFAEHLGQKQELMRSSNWLVYSFSLWLRSKAEFNRTKWRERSCLQMLNIEDQFKDVTPSFGHRCLYAFQLDYPNIWELKYQVGNRFMKIGSTLTAKQMFQDIKMWDECVQCLRVAGRKNEALELVKEKLLENPHSLPLNCSLGDLTNEEGPFEKAWQLSQGRYSRAARSLGKLWFERQDLDKAIDWFKQALDLQPMMPATQFTYGCCLMRRGAFAKALDAFAIVTALEPEQAEAWANMASVHTANENWDAAKRCIAQAARLGQHLWRVWDNYARISVKTNDVYSVLEALEHIVQLGKSDTIEVWMLHFVAKSVVSKRETVLEKILEAEKNQEGRSAEDLRAVKESLESTFQDMLQRALKFFSQFFFSYSHSLPSDPNCQDPLKSCCDRYRIWTLVTETAGLVSETWEIRLKQIRHLTRVTEDVCKNGKTETVQQDVSVCIELLGRSINEIWSLRPRLTQKHSTTSPKMLLEFERFLRNTEERYDRAIGECVLISSSSEKQVLRQELKSIVSQAMQAISH